MIMQQAIIRCNVYINVSLMSELLGVYDVCFVEKWPNDHRTTLYH